MKKYSVKVNITKKCPVCNRRYPDTEYYCYNDNHPLVTFDPSTEPLDIPKPMSKSKPIKKRKNIPKCPTCGSTNVRRTSTIGIAIGFRLYGMAPVLTWVRPWSAYTAVISGNEIF